MSQSRYSPRVIPWQKDWDDTDVTCLRAALGFAVSKGMLLTPQKTPTSYQSVVH